MLATALLVRGLLEVSSAATACYSSVPLFILDKGVRGGVLISYKQALRSLATVTRTARPVPGNCCLPGCILCCMVRRDFVVDLGALVYFFGELVLIWYLPAMCGMTRRLLWTTKRLRFPTLRRR